MAFEVFNKSPLPSNYVVYDYETYGTNVKNTAISQVAALRLDRFANPADDKLNLKIFPSGDRLVSPVASLITKLDLKKLSQQGNPDGVYESDAICRLNDMFLQKQSTCILGYNNINFDDRITEHVLFRNFLNPYEWRWKDFNTRIDLLNLVVAYHSLYPQILRSWPKKQDTQRYSYKLEDIAAANNLNQENAHDAFSDVTASADLFKAFLDGTLLSEHERNTKEYNKVFNYLMGFRAKKSVNEYLKSVGTDVIIYFSPQYSRETRGAIPVLVLNNFVSQYTSDIVLLNLLADREELKEFLSYDQEELNTYFSLGSRFRKIKSPIIKVQDNKFPLFARAQQCANNTELSSVEVQETFMDNLNYIREMSNDHLGKLITTIFKADDCYWSTQTPDPNFIPAKLLRSADAESEFGNNQGNNTGNQANVASGINCPEIYLNYITECHRDNLSFDSYKEYFPDTNLYQLLGFVFNEGKVLFDNNKAKNVATIEADASLISLNSDISKLLILYKGNNEYNNMPVEQRIEYLDMRLKRLKVSLLDHCREVERLYKSAQSYMELNQWEEICNYISICDEFFFIQKNMVEQELNNLRENR